MEFDARDNLLPSLIYYNPLFFYPKMLSIQKIEEKKLQVCPENGTRNEHTYAKPNLFFDKTACHTFYIERAVDWWWYNIRYLS